MAHTIECHICRAELTGVKFYFGGLFYCWDCVKETIQEKIDDIDRDTIDDLTFDDIDDESWVYSDHPSVTSDDSLPGERTCFACLRPVGLPNIPYYLLGSRTEGYDRYCMSCLDEIQQLREWFGE